MTGPKSETRIGTVYCPVDPVARHIYATDPAVFFSHPMLMLGASGKSNETKNLAAGSVESTVFCGCRWFSISEGKYNHVRSFENGCGMRTPSLSHIVAIANAFIIEEMPENLINLISQRVSTYEQIIGAVDCHRVARQPSRMRQLSCNVRVAVGN
jgi:hypothetical protein